MPKGRPSPAHASLPERVKRARKALGLTGAELARRANVSRMTITHLEAGDTVPGVDTVEALAKALEVDPCWLAYGRGTPPEWLTSRKKARAAAAEPADEAASEEAP